VYEVAGLRLTSMYKQVDPSPLATGNEHRENAELEAAVESEAA